MNRKPKKIFRKPIPRRSKFGSQSSGSSSRSEDHIVGLDSDAAALALGVPGDRANSEHGSGSTRITGQGAPSIGFSTPASEAERPLGTTTAPQIEQAIGREAASLADGDRDAGTARLAILTENPEIADAVERMVGAVATDAVAEATGSSFAGAGEGVLYDTRTQTGTSARASTAVSTMTSTSRKLQANLIALSYALANPTSASQGGQMSEDAKIALINSLIVYGNPNHNGGQNYAANGREASTPVQRDGLPVPPSGPGRYTNPIAWASRNLTPAKHAIFKYIGGITTAGREMAGSGDWRVSEVRQRAVFVLKVLVDKGNLFRAKIMGYDTTLIQAVNLASTLENSSNIRADIEQLETFRLAFKKKLNVEQKKRNNPQTVTEALVHKARTEGRSPQSAVVEIARYSYVHKKIQLARIFLKQCENFGKISVARMPDLDKRVAYKIFAEIFHLRRQTQEDPFVLSPGTAYSLAQVCMEQLLMNPDTANQILNPNTMGYLINKIVTHYNTLISEVGPVFRDGQSEQIFVDIYKINQADQTRKGDMETIDMNYRVIRNTDDIPFGIIKKLREFLQKVGAGRQETETILGPPSGTRLGRQSGIHPFYRIAQLITGRVIRSGQLQLAFSFILAQIKVFPIDNSKQMELDTELLKLVNVIERTPGSGYAITGNMSQIQRYWGNMFQSAVDTTSVFAEVRALSMFVQQIPLIAANFKYAGVYLGTTGWTYLRLAAKAAWRAKGLPSIHSIEMIFAAFAFLTYLASTHRRYTEARGIPHGAVGDGPQAILVTLAESIRGIIRENLNNPDNRRKYGIGAYNNPDYIERIYQLLLGDVQLNQPHGITVPNEAGDARNLPQGVSEEVRRLNAQVEQNLILFTHLTLYPSFILRAIQLPWANLGESVPREENIALSRRIFNVNSQASGVPLTQDEQEYNSIHGVQSPGNTREAGPIMRNISFLFTPVAADAMATLTSAMMRLVQVATPEPAVVVGASTAAGPQVQRAPGMDAERAVTGAPDMAPQGAGGADSPPPARARSLSGSRSRSRSRGRGRSSSSEEEAAAPPSPPPAPRGRATRSSRSRSTARSGGAVFGKLMKALRPYDKFVVLPRKNKRRPELSTKFGSKKLLDDKKGLYVNANNKKWYLYKW